MYTRETREALGRITLGMDVIDIHDNKIGTVRDIQFGDEDPAQPGTQAVTTAGADDSQRDTLFDDIAEAFVGEDRLPEALRARMLRHGFVRVDAGWFSRDRFVLADQISHVDEHVHLKVAEDTLIKI
jgi:hypothetical protein